MPIMNADSPEKKTAATLYVVATPIGNLGDLTQRAREVLGSVHLIAAEDTRHTGNLLQAFGIQAKLISLHDHNEAARVPELIEVLRGGQSVALVSDAGTPLISDPGYRLIQAAAAAGLPVSPVPGACAAIAALSAAVLPSDRFSFEGFLSSKPTARRAQLQSLAADTRTLIFYEAPHRLEASLEDLQAAFGADRPAAVARELTKTYETIYRAPLGELLRLAQSDPDMQRGEIVLLVAGAPVRADEEGAGELERTLKILLENMPVSQAADMAARLTGAPRNQAYKLALRLARDN
jgi:16S rRNA (cytidine1402-2'-O)-methyltransferase